MPWLAQNQTLFPYTERVHSDPVDQVPLLPRTGPVLQDRRTRRMVQEREVRQQTVPYDSRVQIPQRVLVERQDHPSV